MGLYVKIAHAQEAQRQFPVLNVLLWRPYSLAVKQTGLTSPLQGGTVFPVAPIGERRQYRVLSVV